MTEIVCKACLSAPPAVEGLCILCAREQLPAAKPHAPGRGIQPWRRPPENQHGNRQDRTLPAGLLTAAEAAKKRGFSVRTARNRASDHKIGVKFGREWGISSEGLDALADNDTGCLVDVQRQIEEMSEG